MSYKFLNTIIDDLFAFVIKMPLLHRLSGERWGGDAHDETLDAQGSGPRMDPHHQHAQCLPPSLLDYPLNCFNRFAPTSNTRSWTHPCAAMPPLPAVFRDDVIFLIYLYQRWIYRVDKSRANEFGYVC